MGCCEFRDGRSDLIPTQKGIRRMNIDGKKKTKHQRTLSPGLPKHVSFVFPEFSGELPHSLSKKVP